MSDPIKVLFICTANACRSQMAEALLRHLDPVRFEAFSAGSNPAGYIHPLAVAAMKELDVPIAGQYSKGWYEFAGKQMDLVITVCEAAAGQVCPVWPGAPLTVNWPILDPVGLAGSESERLDSAVRTAGRLKTMLDRLIGLDFRNLSRDELTKRLEEIGPEGFGE